MSNITVCLAYKDSAWFIANNTVVLEAGQHVHLSDGTGYLTDAYKIGDGSTQLQALPWKGAAPIEKREQFVISGTSVTLTNTPIGPILAYLNGVFCQIGTGFIITSVIGNTITFDQDYTGSDFTAIYKSNT